MSCTVSYIDDGTSARCRLSRGNVNQTLLSSWLDSVCRCGVIVTISRALVRCSNGQGTNGSTPRPSAITHFPTTTSSPYNVLEFKPYGWSRFLRVAIARLASGRQENKCSKGPEPRPQPRIFSRKRGNAFGGLHMLHEILAACLVVTYHQSGIWSRHTSRRDNTYACWCDACPLPNDNFSE